MAVTDWLRSPRLSSQAISSLSPAFTPFRRNANTGLRDTAWLIWPSSIALPFTLTLTSWMKCTGTRLPFASLRWPVSMGCTISTRTSAMPSFSVARILIGSAMSASAAPDGHLDFLRRGIVTAAGLRHDPHEGRFPDLHVDLDVGQGTFAEIEFRGEREGILLDHYRDRPGVRQITGDFDRHDRA